MTVKSNGAAGSPKTIAVTLVVSGAPELLAVPAGLSFFMKSGGSNPPTQSLLVAYTGEAPVAWTAAPSAPWLSLAPSSGDTPGTVTLSVNGAGLAKGTYTDTVLVEAAGIPDGRRTIPVELVMESPGGEACDPEAWYCEPFDALALGDVDGQGGWDRIGANATGQVQADPRGPGRVLILEAPDGGFVKDTLAVTPHPIEGSEFSVQVMTRDVRPGSKSVAKIQFLTSPGDGWAKNHRTFATIRVGARMVFQYGHTLSQDLMPMQSGRWYEVRLRYEGGQVHVSVDGQLKFSTESGIAAGLTFQGYTNTAWPFPGLAGFDMLQAKSPEPISFVVEPDNLSFAAVEGGKCPGPPPSRASFTSRGRRIAPRAAEGPASAEPMAKGTGRIGANLPLAFEPNLGQAGPRTAFVARGPGYSLMLNPTDVRLTLTQSATANDPEASNPQKSPHRPAAPEPGLRSDVRLALLEAGNPTLEGADLLPGRSHYLRGPAAGGRVVDVPNYRSVRYRGVYPGIDLVFRGDEGRLEYDWIVAPGAEPSRIAMGIEGARSVTQEPGGALVLSTDAGPLRMERPYIYQDTDSGRREVKGAFVRLDEARIGFAVEAYDRTATLVIDPVLTYSTYFNESGYASHIALDDSGNIHVGGYALSLADRPPGTDVGPQGNNNLVITKLDPAGTARLFTTYVGGSGNEDLSELAVSSGQVLVAGYTQSTDFPTSTSIGPTYGGGMYDAFVLKLDASGGGLVYSTYLGGSGSDLAYGLAVDHQGSAYVVGSTGSADFPIQAFSPEQPVFQPALKGPSDVFVSKISPTGLLEYSTYYGGSSGDGAIAAVVDADGHAYFTGSTYSIDLPVKFVIHPYGNGFGITPFAAKLDPFGSKLVYSSWLSATYNSGTPTAMALDAEGAAHIVGYTDSETFPTTPGAFQETVEGYASRAFALKINPFGSGFDWSTFLGATPGNHASAVARGPAGQVYVGGHTPSTDLPIPGCFQAFGGAWDGWVLSLTQDGSALAFGTLLGGSGSDYVTDLAVAPSGALYVVGGTESPNMPTVDPLPDSAAAGSFIARIDPTTPFSGASTIYLEAHGGLVNETAGVVNLTVRRLCGTAGAASASYLTEPGTAVSGVNFAPTTGTLASGMGTRRPARSRFRSSTTRNSPAKSRSPST